MTTELKIGQLWKENDARFERVVQVLALDEEAQKVQIAKVNARPGWKMKTWAKMSRFNGKRSGYSLVKEAAQ